MKIATNVSRDAFGGITTSNLAFFDWLKKRGDKIVGVELISSRHFRGPTIFRNYPPEFFSHHIINGLDVIASMSREKRGDARKKWGVLVETTKRILKQEKPDVVFINGTYNLPWILAQAAKELQIPTVLRYAGVLKREAEFKNFFVRKRLLSYERWLASFADRIIFPSKVCQKVVEKEILKSQIKNSVIVPNPINKIRINLNNKKSLKNKKLTIAAIGRWTSIKNFPAFINLHEELLKIQDHRAFLVTSYWDKNFPFPKTLERVDPMSHEDLLDFYKKIDLLVVTSSFETFCNVASEALSNGVPVLVSKNVGFSEVLIKAGLGRMVIDSFDDLSRAAKIAKDLMSKKPSLQEIKKVTMLLDSEINNRLIYNELKKVIID